MTAATSSLDQTASWGVLIGRDGSPFRIWANPSNVAFAEAVRLAAPADLSGLRGLLTQSNLYIWQSVNLLHADFERDTGIHGIRLALRSGEVFVNDETVAMPEHFPWLFPDAVAMDVDDLREAAAGWLRANARLRAIYPTGFRLGWYS
jgi:hypothetical protein